MLNRTASSLSRVEPALASLPLSLAIRGPVTPRQVWVVDPQTNHRDSLARAADRRLHGVVFQSVASQTEALGLLMHLRQFPAVIITDFRGDLKINGAEFITRARRLCPPETRFVLFSALVEGANGFRRLAGHGYDLPDAIVPKPDAFRLVQVLAALLPPLPLNGRREAGCG